MTKFLKRALSLAMVSAAAMTMAISANAATYTANYKGFGVGACVEANTEFKTHTNNHLKYRQNTEDVL